MGNLAIFKKAFTGKTLEPRAYELAEYVKELDGQLNTEWSRRVNGDGVYSGYKILKEFYRGQQWSYRKENGATMRTYNYVFTVVENMTAFLTNEAPQMSCPPKDISNAIERAVAEGKTKLLDAIHEENFLSLVFQRGVRTGSMLGDAFIFGPIPTFTTDDDGKKIFDKIRYFNIEKPETIRPIWKDENFSELAGFIKQYRIAVVTAKRLFKEEIDKYGLVVEQDYDTQNPGEIDQTGTPMCTVSEYWDDKEYLLMFGPAKKAVHYVKHDWDYIPLQHVPNVHVPGQAGGTSDIEHELDPQQEYNERASDMADIIKEMSRPAYWGKNLDNLTEVRSGETVIYQVGDDGDIQAMPKSGSTVAIETYLNDRKNDMISISGLNQVLYPGAQTLQATGRALSVVMQGVNNKISLRKEWWIKAFKEINKNILFLSEIYIPGAKDLIGGYYKTDVFISSVLLRSVSDEINKFQAKIQSLTTTQQNVGIQNPGQEQKLMKEELQDEILATEIAKQPGLLHQILQENIAKAQEAGGVAGAPGAISSESENAPGENPQSGRGVASPISPEGAIKQKAARAGASTQLKK